MSNSFYILLFFFLSVNSCKNTDKTEDVSDLSKIDILEIEEIFTDFDEISSDSANITDFPPPIKAIIPLDGEFLLPVKINNKKDYFYFVIDTGAIRTAVDETLLDNVKNGVANIDLNLGNGILLNNYEVLAADLTEASNHIGITISGLIGLDIFNNFFFYLDYKNKEIYITEKWLDTPLIGFNKNNKIAVPYQIKQGMPMIEVTINDKKANLIADTGSGVTIVTESMVSEELLNKGLKGYRWYTNYGFDEATIIRLPSLIIEEYEVKYSWVVVVPDNFHLKKFFDQIGVSIDGFLGFPVYRRFFVIVLIKNSNSLYDFYPYNDLNHINEDEWNRIGIEIKKEQNKIIIDMVFQPSDAYNQGLQTGDILLSVNELQVEDFELDEIRMMLRDTPDKTKALKILRNQKEINLTIQVNQLLPYPKI